MKSGLVDEEKAHAGDGARLLKTEQGLEAFQNATPRPWLREIHDASGDRARIVIVSRHPRFECGYYVVCADEMQRRRDQAIAAAGEEFAQRIVALHTTVDGPQTTEVHDES